MRQVPNNQWESANSGIKSSPEPIPLSLSIPGNYSVTTQGGPVLLSPSIARFQISPPIVVPRDCSCSLIAASFTFSQPNIAPRGVVPGIINGNNRISIAWNGGALTDYTLPLGLYSLADVQLALNQIAVAQGWMVGATELFILTGIAATQKAILSLNPAALTGGVFPAGGVQISFVNPGVLGFNDSIGPVLGFPTAGLGSVINIPGGGAAIVSTPAPNVANFANISSYNLYISILKNSYLNGSTGQLLYSFPIGAYTPNSVVSYQPTLRFPVQCDSNSYSTIDVWTTDQAGNPLPWVYYQSPFSFSCLISKNKADGSI